MTAPGIEVDVELANDALGEDPVGDVSIAQTRSKVKAKYHDRVLVFGRRGISKRERHLLKDIRSLLPHHRAENKLDERGRHNVAEVTRRLTTISRCNLVLFLDNRKRKDLFMWLGKQPNGPSVKFLVSNIHTMAELKLAGNCIKGSRPLLHFDSAFSTEPHLKVVRALLTQVFGTPQHHPNSKPFVDHVFCFFWLDGRIWFRNYQIVEKEVSKKEIERSLLEIGPRMVLQPITILSNCLHGKLLWVNPAYVAPNALRSMLRKKKEHKDKDEGSKPKSTTSKK
eukprot:TRINITY_DN58018_c0_g1_i1.p1 TRINITY_DN58018_c0_g1~~TRINITY_DN58018_c0_g1_i1.p1  ORF type:complete len:292 (-),score=62.62 TRINITY_DN58018_c0_g1_i1:73-918(-)